MNNPKIKLISISGHSKETFSKVWGLAKNDLLYDEIPNLSSEELEKFMSTDIPTQEYVNMIWSIEGMPRAFWDQLDRCRLAAFWEQSARVIDLSTFADDKRYWTSEIIAANPVKEQIYDKAMQDIQEAYQSLVDYGVPVEEARGVIPLHILTRGTMCINLRALKGLIKNRICFIMQGSYWFSVIDGMLQELKKQLPEGTLRSIVNLPCHGCERCPIEGNVLHRISGDDPNPVCPVYIKRFCENREEVEAIERQRHPNYSDRKAKYFRLLRTLEMGGGDCIDSKEN